MTYTAVSFVTFADRVIVEIFRFVKLTGVTLSTVGGTPDAKMPTSPNPLTAVVSEVFVEFAGAVSLTDVVPFVGAVSFVELSGGLVDAFV